MLDWQLCQICYPLEIKLLLLLLLLLWRPLQNKKEPIYYNIVRKSAALIPAKLGLFEAY